MKIYTLIHVKDPAFEQPVVETTPFAEKSRAKKQMRDECKQEKTCQERSHALLNDSDYQPFITNQSAILNYYEDNGITQETWEIRGQKLIGETAEP